MWYGGLIRGAIAFALTYRLYIVKEPSHVGVIRQNTLMIVVITTVAFGSLMTLFARLLGISVEKSPFDEQVFKRFREVSVASLDELLIPENRLSVDQEDLRLPMSKT